jgi:hypothetical protein
VCMWARFFAGRFNFPQAKPDGRDKTMLCTNETARKEIVSVKNDASQNFVLHFTFSSYRHVFSCMLFTEAHRKIRVLFKR